MKLNTSLKVMNYGPITLGTSKMPEGIEFKKNTIIIGDQGTGKSTVAKLFSSFSWIEKNYFRNPDLIKGFDLKDLLNLLKSSQNLPADYVTSKTFIEYCGTILIIRVSSKNLKFETVETDKYVCPQILYVPSERNLLSVTDGNPSIIKYFPEMVFQLKEEFDRINISKGVRRRKLFKGYSISYEPNQKSSFISIDDVSVPLSLSSSGLQSLAPLLVVSEYMSSEVHKDFLDKLITSRKSGKLKFAIEQLLNEDLKSKVEAFQQSGLRTVLSEKDVQDLNNLLSQYINSCFIEIVEEPEQNLFPTSQVLVLDKLISYTKEKNDKLVITTHSPYILSAINNYLLANDLYQKNISVNRIVPTDCLIDFDETAAYKIEDGVVKSILAKDSRMISVDEIDNCSEKINKQFDRLYGKLHAFN